MSRVLKIKGMLSFIKTYYLYLLAAIFTGVDGMEFTYRLVEHSTAVTYDGKYRSNFQA